MGNENSIAGHATNHHGADRDRDLPVMESKSEAAIPVPVEQDFLLQEGANGHGGTGAKENGDDAVKTLPDQANGEGRKEVSVVELWKSEEIERQIPVQQKSSLVDSENYVTMLEGNKRPLLQEDPLAQSGTDARSSVIAIDPDDKTFVSKKVQEHSDTLSEKGPCSQPVDPAIALLEKNLIQVINDSGGSLAVSSWAAAYQQKFGEKAFKKHTNAANAEKLKQLLPRFQSVTRGDGIESQYLFNHPRRNQRKDTVGPLITLENKLLLIIQSRMGNAKMKQLRADFKKEYGPKALEKAIRDSGYSTLEQAIQKMARICSKQKNNKVVYVANPMQPVAIPQTTAASLPQTSAVQPQDSGPQTPDLLSLIDSNEKFERWDDNFLRKYLQDMCQRHDSGEQGALALSCPGGSEKLFLILIAFTEDDIFAFDCLKLDVQSICEKLKPIFESTIITKLVHDLRYDAVALRRFGNVSAFCGMMDTQLVVEYMHDEFHCTFADMLDCFELNVPSSLRMKLKSTPKTEVYARRPISGDLLSPLFGCLKVLIQSISKIRENFDSRTWKAVGEASDIRANAFSTSFSSDLTRRVSFDVSRGYRMVSYELLNAVHPENMMKEQPLEVVQDIISLLNILPRDVQETLAKLDTTHLADIVFDKGRRPHAWICGKREMLFPADRLVESEEIESIAERVRFGSDNRAGLERQLHRISAIRNRESSIIGMTVRVGRHISGNAGIIADLLFNRAGASILFLGEPGSGKTTIVREVTRILAEETNVCIVDTSNEIAGDGDVPHPCVGLARRLMVPTLDKQSAVMIEAVQNHTPSVMVIDEIGRKTEVEAAQTCKNRGVRLIASAHGDLRKLVKNPKIRGVIGGIESVTLGDIEARKEGKKHGEEISKVKTQRAGAPIFEIVIELERGSYDSWRVVTDSAKAVDSILERQHYEAQRRTREPQTGAIHLSFENA